MTKIDVYTDDMASLSARLKKISANIADAKNMAASVRGNLNFQVAAKSGIQTNIANAEKKIKTQGARILDLSKAATVSAEEFKNADGQLNKKAKNILGKITLMLANVKDSVKRLFMSLTISRHKAINDIFLTAGAIAVGGGGVGILAALKQMLEKQGKTSGNVISGIGTGTGTIDGNTSGEGRHDGAKTGDSGNIATDSAADAGSGGAETPVEPEVKQDKEDKDQKELEIINKRYQTLPSVAKGFTGKCGAFVFQQLLVQKIVTKNARESTEHGKDYARVLAKKETTSTGYAVTNYGDGDNAFDNFLEATKGKSPLTNIVCSFKKGSTTNNAKHGHTMLISKIENGKVYYIDNRRECRQPDGSYAARCITIKEFKKIYFKAGNNCTGITGLG